MATILLIDDEASMRGLGSIVRFTIPKDVTTMNPSPKRFLVETNIAGNFHRHLF